MSIASSKLRWRVYFNQTDFSWTGIQTSHLIHWKILKMLSLLRSLMVWSQATPRIPIKVSKGTTTRIEFQSSWTWHDLRTKMLRHGLNALSSLSMMVMVVVCAQTIWKTTFIKSSSLSLASLQTQGKLCLMAAGSAKRDSSKWRTWGLGSISLDRAPS